MLAFPCNQFGGQEPGSDADIQAFAQTQYDVNFPMFAKIEVNGSGACALYEWLKSAAPADDGSTDIAWNFTKFLVARDGTVIRRFAPQTSPEDIGRELTDWL